MIRTATTSIDISGNLNFLIPDSRHEKEIQDNRGRYGLDYLRSIVTDLDLKQDEFLHSLQFLSCT